MATQRTRAKVHAAVLSLVSEQGSATVTMEGIAARAAVSKQTLYSSWSSTGEILFDALLARSVGSDGKVSVPDSGDLALDLEILVTATIAELTDPAQEPLLRIVTAALQHDGNLAAQYRDRLLAPQFTAIADRLRHGGIDNALDIAELLLGPIFHRWLLRTGTFDPGWPREHVARVLRAGGGSVR